ncbi:MAG: hypothetical protein C5B60_09770 [Chloroflexi bacterium]|nr:MAG: hypothetical protein C5B60_09770 [Chloroflexota bacterium]
MPLRGVLQTRWLRGLNAAFSIFSQPPNSLPRLSNLVLTRRGSLQTVDGSRIVSSYGNLGPLPWDPIDRGMWKEIFYYQPNDHPERTGYYGLREEPHFPQLVGFTSGPTHSVVSVPGAVALGTVTLSVTVADGVGGETPLSPAVTVTVGAGQGVHLTVFRVLNAAGYNVYVLRNGVWERLIPIGSTNPFATVTVVNPIPPPTPWPPPPSNVSFVLAAGVASNPTATPPIVGIEVPGGPHAGNIAPSSTNTTQSCNFIKIPVDGTGWNYAFDLIYTFPADLLPNPGGSGSGQRIGGAAPGPQGGGGSAGTINGGVLGIISPIPQIIQFADLMFLALGNGIVPFESVGLPGPNNTKPIFNTFQATIPGWQPQIGYIIGDQIAAAEGTNNPTGTPQFIFTAIQGGISAAGVGPNFPATLDKTVADGQVIWKNIGVLVTPPTPRGAAHVEVYAGSLWVANTSPVFLPQFPSDGPSAIWMSDANNPNSWNPLNTAQINRDDGTEIMGLKAFAVAEAGIITQQQLVVFKNFTTYLINGVFGAADFAIQQCETDQGCIAPRTIQFVPGFGLMRLTHLGVSAFDGVKDTLFSTEIYPYLFGDLNQPDIKPIDWAFAYFSKAAQVADPPMYIMACPVLGDNCQLLGSLPAAQFTIAVHSQPNGVVPPQFPPGTYFFRITLRGPLMETAISPELGPITIPGNVMNQPPTALPYFTVQSSLPLPTGYTGWRVYWGSNGPGSETHYQDTGPEMASPSFTTLQFPGTTITGTPLGLSGTMTRIFCFDLTLKCWTIVDLPFSISVLKQFRIMGQPPVVISGGFWDTTVRRLFSHGIPDWDGVPIDWFMRTTEVYDQGGDVRIHYRRLRIRGSGLGPVIVLPNYDGFDGVPLPALFRALGSNQFQAEAGLMSQAVNCHADISGSGPVLIDSVDFHAVPTAIGAGAVIS